MATKRSGARHWVRTMHALRNAPAAQAFRERDHSRRVADLAEAVATAMRLPEKEVATIRLAGLLHDVGNIGLSDDILLKPGPLTEAEFGRIREHVDRSARDFRALDALRPAISIVRHHHERMDGSGYPEGLRGKEIPLGARVVAAADAYVMMTANLPWRAAKSHEDAIAELQEEAGAHLDEEVVQQLISVLRTRGKSA